MPRKEANGDAGTSDDSPMSVRTGNKTLGVWRKVKTLESMPKDAENETSAKSFWADMNFRPRGLYLLSRFRMNTLPDSDREDFKKQVLGETVKTTPHLDHVPEKMAHVLKQDVRFNINSRDTTGNSPLLLAVKNDHPEVVDRLLNKASYGLMKEALLLSISLEHHQISESIIRHPRYTRTDEAAQRTLTSQVSETTLDVTSDDTIFTADVTPLVLAAQRNQFDIVKLLLSLGETIKEPHSYSCQCQDCRGAQSFDELRFAKTRLNTNKGLASEAYISLSSPDPFLTAFRLGRIFKRNIQIERYFKGEYKQMIEQLGDYTVKLLDKVRDGEELDIILNESRGTPFSDLGKMARLKLAIRYDGKRFVAHAGCQKKITEVWYGNIARFQQMESLSKVLWVSLYSVLYPFLAILFWIYPYGKIGKYLSTPVVKFIADALAHLALVVLILLYSVNEYASEGHRLLGLDQDGIGTGYQQYIDKCNETDVKPLIENVFIRSDHFGITAYVLCVFVLGFVWQLVKEIAKEKLHFITDNWFNIFDVILFGLYSVSLLLRFITGLKVRAAMDHFSKTDSWNELLESNGTNDGGHLYWMDADRQNWDQWDLFIVAEAMFAVANVMCITRTASMLTTSEIIGPLIIALRLMIKNVLKFMSIFLIVIVAFLVGFNSLYWYYDIGVRRKAEIVPSETSEAEKHFGRIIFICRSIFFTLFGMIDSDAVEVGDAYHGFVTTNVGYLMLGAYNWISIIILINMLIAMMAKSYLFIEGQKDIEWKFSRTKLYLEYIKEGNVLCVPFNLIPSLWGLINLILYIGTCCGCRNSIASDTERKKQEKKKQKEMMKFRNKSVDGEDTIKRGDDKIKEDQRRDSLDDVAVDEENDGTNKQSKENDDKYTLPEHYTAIAEKFSLQKVIEKIITRFIVHSITKKQVPNGQNGDSNSALGVIKRDMSNFRYQMMQALRSQDEGKLDLKDAVASLDTMLKSTSQNVEEVGATCTSLEKTLLEEIRQNQKLTNDRLAAVEEKVKYSREDSHNYEANVSMKLKEMESNFSNEMTKFANLNSTLSTIESNMRLLASELKEVKTTVATLSTVAPNNE